MSSLSYSVNSLYRQGNFDKTNCRNNESCGKGAPLDMLAEVASQKLYNEVALKGNRQSPVTDVNDDHKQAKKRLCNSKKSYDKDNAHPTARSSSSICKKYPPYCQIGGRNSVRYNMMTASQISGLSTSQLVKLFTVLEGDEMKRTFYFQCRFLSNCQERFFSFGSEEKAKHLVIQHLNKHVQQMSSDSVIEVPLKYIVPLNKKSSCVKHLKKVIVPKLNTVNDGNNNSYIKNRQKKFVIGKDEQKNEKFSIKLEERKNRIKQSLKKDKKSEMHHKPVLIMKTSLRRTTDERFSPSILSHRTVPCPVVPPSDETQTISKSNNISYHRFCQAKDHNYYRHLATTSGSVGVKDDQIENMTDKTASCASNVYSNCVNLDSGTFNQPIVPNGNNVPNFNNFEEDSSIDSDNRCDEFTNKNCTANFKSSEGNCTAHESIQNEDNILFDYLTMPVAQEVVVETEASIVDHCVSGIANDRNVDGGNQCLQNKASSLRNHFEFDSAEINLIQDNLLRSEASRLEKKPKGKAKFIGQSAEEREMAVEMIKTLKKGGGGLECRICQPKRVFTAPTTLISHYRSHAGIKPYECVLCKAVFTRQHSLNYHLLIHLNQTRFTCEDCGRKFRHPSHFKEHQRRHTGESPFQCPDCTFRFKTRNTYKRHLKTRHGKILTHSGAIVTVSTNTVTFPVNPDMLSRNTNEENVDAAEEIIISNDCDDSEINCLAINNNINKPIIISCNNDLDKENNSITIVNNKTNTNQDIMLSKGMKPSVLSTGGVGVKITEQNQIDRSSKGAVFFNFVPTLQQHSLHQILQGDNVIPSGRASTILFLTTNNTNISNNFNHNDVVAENVNSAATVIRD